MVCPPWAAVLGGRTRVDADNRKFTNPLTGEPDAGNPPVRFGGRGKVNPLSLPLSSRPGLHLRAYHLTRIGEAYLYCLSLAERCGGPEHTFRSVHTDSLCSSRRK